MTIKVSGYAQVRNNLYREIYGGLPSSKQAYYQKKARETGRFQVAMVAYVINGGYLEREIELAIRFMFQGIFILKKHWL